MGFYNFSWPHPANEVLVTGTFDDWSGSKQLEKNPETGLFSAVVNLGEAERTYYKYIVDGNWTVNHDARKEMDSPGNENNVLYQEDLMATAAPVTEEPKLPVAGESENIFTSSVAPTSTTAELAAEVPFEEKAPLTHTPGVDDVPGGYPETPALETESKEPEVLPVAPPVLLPVVTPVEERTATSTGVLDVPAPTLESSSPVPDVTTADVPEVVKESQEKAHVEPEASTVPEAVETKKVVENEIERSVPEAPVTVEGHNEPAERLPEPPQKDEEIPAASVPEVVKESQALALASPEACVNEALVEKKAEVEDELVSHPPHLHHAEAQEAQPIVADEKPPQVLAPIVLAAQIVETATPADTVPEVVKDSQAAHAEPEASPVPTAIVDKEKVEEELKSEVKPVQPTIRAVEPETQANGTRSVSPTMSPLTTPAAPTTSTFTTAVSGTFNAAKTDKSDKSSTSSASSSKSSHKSHDEKQKEKESLKDKTPEKKKEKRRSVLLSRILNVFK